MKIFEITNDARKIIKKLNQFFIKYSTYGRIHDQDNLWKLIEKDIMSSDPDIKKQANIYKDKLLDEIIDRLSK